MLLRRPLVISHHHLLLVLERGKHTEQPVVPILTCLTLVHRIQFKSPCTANDFAVTRCFFYFSTNRSVRIISD